MTRASSSRGRKPRRRPDPVPRTIAAGLVVLIGVVAFIALGIKAFDGVPGKRYTTMFVEVPQAGNVIRHDPVRIGGVRVGQVLGRSVTSDGRARLQLQLQRGIVLARDTRVEIRANGLLGARYVSLIPGRSRAALDDHATIRGGRSALTYGVPDALDTFDRQTRGALGRSVAALGEGLSGNGTALNGMIGVIDAKVRPVRDTVAALLAREGSVRRLVPSAASAMRPLAAHRATLTELPVDATDATASFDARRDRLGETVDLSPPTLRAATPGLAQGTRLVAAVDRFARAIEPTLRPARAGLEQATALLREARVPLRRTAPVVRSLRRASGAVAQATDAVDPVLEPLRAGLTDVSHVVREVGRYRCDLENFGATFRSMTGFGGQGEGPNGPPGEFRAYVALPTIGHAVGLKDDLTFGLGRRDSYVAPCTYLSAAYPTIGAREEGR